MDTNYRVAVKKILSLDWPEKCRLAWQVKACGKVSNGLHSKRFRRFPALLETLATQAKCLNKIYSFLGKYVWLQITSWFWPSIIWMRSLASALAFIFYWGFLTFITFLYICTTYFWENVTRNICLPVWQTWSWKILRNLKVFAWLVQYCTSCY